MKQDSNFKIMMQMIQLVKPLSGFMILAILLGVFGYLCAIFIPVTAIYFISQWTIGNLTYSLSTLFVCMIVFAFLRGIFHYGEQACNHYIAFKLLAIIRNRVFKTLRRLCPAKLEGKDRGNLIFMITSDIEALEVFYAHTISPVLIAILVCCLLLYLFFKMHYAMFLLALVAYVFVGCILPMITTKLGKEDGKLSRQEFGELSNYTLESLRGIQDVLQYDLGNERLEEMEKKSKKVSVRQKKLKDIEGKGSSLSNLVVMLFSLGMVLISSFLYEKGQIDFSHVLIGSVLMMSSFGPVIALSNVSNNLLVTMAAARRVLGLLKEKELVQDVQGKRPVSFGNIKVSNVTFAYEQEEILKDFSAYFEKGKITGILGKSGCGKSTLLKLLMRFWNVDQGKIEINKVNIQDINTKNLRNMQSYVTQDTVLFHDSILNNIKIAKLDASKEEVIEACKKANIHNFIMTLPEGYETKVAELGESLSGGERQRISLARAFLHDADCILLDEPTSNLDALNEAEILNNLKKQKDKTILLVSHRMSTLKIADTVLKMENENAAK